MQPHRCDSYKVQTVPGMYSRRDELVLVRYKAGDTASNQSSGQYIVQIYGQNGLLKVIEKQPKLISALL